MADADHNDGLSGILFKDPHNVGEQLQRTIKLIEHEYGVKVTRAVAIKYGTGFPDSTPTSSHNCKVKINTSLNCRKEKS